MCRMRLKLNSGCIAIKSAVHGWERGTGKGMGVKSNERLNHTIRAISRAVSFLLSRLERRFPFFKPQTHEKTFA